jgi:hypothetical protein
MLPKSNRLMTYGNVLSMYLNLYELFRVFLDMCVSHLEDMPKQATQLTGIILNTNFGLVNLDLFVHFLMK